jgi:hypothetical protein
MQQQLSCSNSSSLIVVADSELEHSSEAMMSMSMPMILSPTPSMSSSSWVSPILAPRSVHWNEIVSISTCHLDDSDSDSDDEGIENKHRDDNGCISPSQKLLTWHDKLSDSSSSSSSASSSSSRLPLPRSNLTAPSNLGINNDDNNAVSHDEGSTSAACIQRDLHRMTRLIQLSLKKELALLNKASRARLYRTKLMKKYRGSRYRLRIISSLNDETVQHHYHPHTQCREHQRQQQQQQQQPQRLSHPATSCEA